jgi:hypothetical protein
MASVMRRGCLAFASLAFVAAACRQRGNVYPPEVVENFMRACTVRASEKACRCSLAEIQRRYTLEQYRALEAAIAADKQVPGELREVSAACR